MNCPACGTDNREGASFCRHCGEALAEEPESEAPTAAGPEADTIGEPEPAELAADRGVEAEEAAVEAEVSPEESPAEAEGMEDPSGELAGESQAVAMEGAEAEGETGIEEEEVPSEPEAGDLAEEAEETELPLESEDELLAFWREEIEPLIPVELQTVIADRYEIVEVLDAQEEEILYLAHDRRRCWQCDFEGNIPGDGFCAQCGASLELEVEVRLLEVRDAGAEPSGGGQVAARLAHEGRTLLLLAEPEPEAAAPAEPERFHLLVGQRSDPGLVRDLNEDSLLAFIFMPTYESRTGPVQGLFAVADGMGGHEGGEVASKMALQILADRVLRTIVLSELGGQMLLDDEIVVRLRQATIAANDAVYLARQKAENDMGTTLTVAFVRDRHLFLSHVGDCRAYRWNADGLEQLTVDHSVVASMVTSGQAAPEEIYTHPHRSIIYRCIGDKPMVEVDSDRLPLTPGDRLVLCSDGLWEMLRNEGIEDVMLQEAEPQAACEVLVSRANAAGGDDNISVIVIQVDVA
jgi:serine/threonine protein phosphatase PrpC